MDSIWSPKIDICASIDNTKCGEYTTKDQDANQFRWMEGKRGNWVFYCNPPYSDVRPWIENGAETAKDGGTVIMNGTFDLSDSSTGMTLNQGGDAITLLDAVKVVTDKFDAADSEPTGVPAANETPLVKLAYTFMALRNKILVSATKKQFFDDGGAVEWEKDLADDGTDYTESEANAP